jgi:hypothetical protein
MGNCFSLEWEKTESYVEVDSARLMTNEQDSGLLGKDESFGDAR